MEIGLESEVGLQQSPKIIPLDKKIVVTIQRNLNKVTENVRSACYGIPYEVANNGTQSVNSYKENPHLAHPRLSGPLKCLYGL